VFDGAALRAVESWTYAPRRVGDLAVEQRGTEARLAFVVP
jgi:hypothetical protein